MQNFMVALLICSVTMSAIALLYMAMPFFSQRYSEKWRYYTWLIVVMGLIIPFRPQWGSAVITMEVTMPTVTYATLPTIMPYAINTATSGAALNISWWPIVFAIWLVGATVFLAYHIIKHFRFMKIVRRWSEKVTDGQILSLYEDIKSEMGIARHIPLYLCPFGSPMVIGLIKPRIFLPTKDLAQDDLRFILRHELVHFRRKDLLYKYLVMVATAFHWFNPVVYLMARTINILCETSCDAEVVQSADMDTRQSYSEALIGVVKYQSKLKTALATNFYGGKKGVKNRISSIMDTRRKNAGIIIACLAVIFTLGTGFVFTTAPVTIEGANRNIRFAMADLTAEFAAGQDRAIIHTSNLSFEEVANVAADAIYQKFGFCIDGMAGYMGFVGWLYPPTWSGAIVSPELTSHSDGDELFTFWIDATTGNVLSVMKNTVESPFLG